MKSLHSNSEISLIWPAAVLDVSDTAGGQTALKVKHMQIQWCAV